MSNATMLSSIPNIPLNPTSGLFINAAGQLDIDCAVLGTRCAWPVGPTNPAPVPYTWTISPSTMQEGGQVTANISGLAPFAMITIRVQPDYGPAEYWSLQADGNGDVLNKKFSLTNGGQNYTFTPIYGAGNPNVGQYVVNVLPCGEVAACTCQGAVTIKPVLSSNSVVSGQPVTLFLIVTNTNACNISELNLPQLVLPANITASAISISNGTVNGKSSRIYEYSIQVQNVGVDPVTVNITVPASAGSFLCNGTPYTAGGGSVALTIAPATGSYCGMIIEEFSISPLTGDEATARTITLTVKNIGTSNITNLNMPPIPLAKPSTSVTAGDTTIEIPTVASLAPGASHTETFTTNLLSLVGLPNNYSITIPVGHIYATCNSSLTSNGISATASTTLTA
jgi:hypothetical protein